MSADYLKGLTNKNAREAGERYGVNHSDYGFNRPGGPGIQKKDPKNYGSDVAKAAMNDYDTRRTIEAAAMSGKKKAQKFAKKGFSNLTDVTKANNMFEKMHDRRGNEGDFSSAEDYAGLTYSMVQRDRNKQEENLVSQNDLNSLRNELEADNGIKDQAEADPQSFEHSDAVSNAQENLEKYKLSLGSSNLFSKQNDPAPRADDQSDATAAFTTQYRADVKKAGRMGETKERNLNNASRAVRSYRQ